MTAGELRAALAEFIEPGRVLTRPIDVVAYASDASFYRMVPKAVVLAATVTEIQRLFAFSRAHGLPLTFRGAGTSLSGQAVSDSILVDVARHWKLIEVLDAGRKVRVGPGVVGAEVNRTLGPWGSKIGPDPASIATCTVGGILANNSSGMCCGVVQNAYHTLDSMRFVLPSGTVVDTADPDADARLSEAEPGLARGLAELRRIVSDDPSLRDRIRTKYRMKNTTGYGLNSLIDYERPVDLLSHLLVGSEGTLAFIAEAVLRTVPDNPVKYTGLLLFSDIRAACAAIVPLRDAGAAALELMDRASLRSVECQPGIPPRIKDLPDEASALLVELQASREADRPALERAAAGAVGGLELLEAPRFTHDPAEQAALWKIRQGLFPSVGSVRARGTTVIIEDVAFPIDRLADAVVDLRRALGQHGYQDAIVFGHAKDGNLHFVLTQSFNDRAAIDRYARLMEALVALVAGTYGGSLKAEHGTGRNMAPFVEAEWGGSAFGLMRRLKALVDPRGLLNPGVIINDDPAAHLAHTKSLPEIEPEVDKCIECGYCEPRCPSRHLTLTPRQRIVVRRELARPADGNDSGGFRASLDADFPYDALDTCAVDGLCATACPVGIDTGQLTKRFRASRHRPIAHRVARLAACHFGATEWLIRTALGAGALARAMIGDARLEAATRSFRRLAGMPTPLWVAPMPGRAPRLPGATPRDGAAAVYFPACVSRAMGALPGEEGGMGLPEAFLALADRAGLPLFLPPDVTGLCCGVPFSSKGYPDAHRAAVRRTIARFWDWSDGGRLPIVVDTSPCTSGLRACREALDPALQERYDRLRILDGVEFVAGQLLPRLTVRRRRKRAVLHPVCSLTKMGLTGALEAIARASAEAIVVPAAAGCCGFAGDRGWLFPELTASATSGEAAEVRNAGGDAHVSSSRTCEVGLSRATGSVYRSYVHLLEWATRDSADL